MGLLDADFDGPCYDPVLDRPRLTGQILRVWRTLQNGRWYTLNEISARTGDPQASVSAQLRHLRKVKFGSHDIEKRRRYAKSGCWEYRLNEPAQLELI